MTSPRDPRLRRAGFTPPVDARAAAGRLEAAADAMRAQQLERGNDEEPPTGLLDLAAIRAALGAEPGGEVNPAAVRWLAGDDEPDPDPLEGQGYDVEDAEDEPHTHPYFVEGCAECVERAEEAEAAEERARAIYDQPEPEPVPVEPPAPVAPMPPVDGAPASAPPPVVPAFISGHAGVRALAWRSRHDERSRAFGVRRGLASSAPLTDHLWPVGRVLDQGADGACVGFGVVDAANATYSADVDRTAADALALFHRADAIDGDARIGVGTSVLAGMKAGVEAGLFGGYLWAFGTKDVAQAVLQRGPVVVGIPWPESWFDAPADGLLTLDAHDTGDQGHCLAVVGLLLHGPRGDLGPYFVLQNSYGPGWGHGGFGYVHHRDLARLLRDRGEAAIPTREALQ